DFENARVLSATTPDLAQPKVNTPRASRPDRKSLHLRRRFSIPVPGVLTTSQRDAAFAAARPSSSLPEIDLMSAVAPRPEGALSPIATPLPRAAGWLFFEGIQSPALLGLMT